MAGCSRCECKCGAKVFVRLAHTALCVGVPLSLLFKETVLSDALLRGQQLIVGILYASLLVFSLVMYFLACCTDPGYLRVRKHWKQQKTVNKNNNMEDADASDSDEGSTMLKFNTEDGDFKYRLCDYCEIEQPMRTKHCEDCGRCVRKYDHHCPWLEACIGERNHKFFWMFLFSTAVLIPCTLFITWHGIAWKPLWGDWFKANILLLIDLLVLIISGFVVVGLLGFHTFLMLRGMTTWEAASRERITYLRYLDEDYNPFNEGLCKNIYYFLCSCRTRKWEGVYANHAEMSGSVA
ncbi:palmitoyltransferase ZDHHC12-A-like [Littorina saxatilis]|uniref:Palmitoyltransferase n=1 Tax=Littorina saxatilis TaxID=31220 RepID=A0AAN9AXR7_9CAEN